MDGMEFDGCALHGTQVHRMPIHLFEFFSSLSSKSFENCVASATGNWFPVYLKCPDVIGLFVRAFYNSICSFYFKKKKIEQTGRQSSVVVVVVTVAAVIVNARARAQTYISCVT